MIVSGAVTNGRRECGQVRSISLCGHNIKLCTNTQFLTVYELITVIQGPVVL